MEAQSAASMVAAAKQKIENLSVDQVSTELVGGDTLLVDVREPEERLQHGGIPGSIHAPRGMIEFYADPSSPYHRSEFETNRRLILHCASGGRSALAAETLQRLGYSRVAHLVGGLTTWKQAGQPVAPDV